MALASDELRRRGDRVGEHALRPAMRTPWTRTSTLIYPAGATLSRHSDGCGNWVVLFSFGRTATFFCGDASEDLESGDAILFNGMVWHCAMPNNSDHDRTAVLIEYLAKFVTPLEDQKSGVRQEVIDRGTPLLRQLMALTYPYPKLFDEAEAQAVIGLDS